MAVHDFVREGIDRSIQRDYPSVRDVARARLDAA